MFFTHTLSLSDKILFYESLSNLLDGGVPLVLSLRGFRDRLTSGALQTMLDNLIFFVENGDSLNVSMRKLPDQFGEKEIAIVESGEQTGLLKNSFEAIAVDLRMQEDLRRKVIGALTYPVIILFFLFLSFLVVMVYVIPQILPLLAETTSELSLATRSLIFMSQTLQANVWYIIAGTIGGMLLFQGFIATGYGKEWKDRILITLPMIGRVYRNYLVVQVLSTLSLLLGSGVSIVRSLRLTASSAGNRTIYHMFHELAEGVSRGEKMTAVIKDIDPERIFFGLDIIQMIETGEKTSTVHTVTEKISVQYRREVDASLAMLVKFIEPVALLLAGIFVLWFAVAIFSAIMQIVSVAGM